MDVMEESLRLALKTYENKQVYSISFFSLGGEHNNGPFTCYRTGFCCCCWLGLFKKCIIVEMSPVPEVFSCSAQLKMKSVLLIKVIIPTILFNRAEQEIHHSNIKMQIIFIRGHLYSAKRCLVL